MKFSKIKSTLILLLMLLSFSCKAQKNIIQREDLQHIILDQHLHQVEMQKITLKKAQKAPAHFHPCPVIGFVVEGEITFEIAGQKPKLLQSGDSFYEPKNVKILMFNNNSQIREAKFIAIYLKEDNEKSIQILDFVK
ncbi:cupin domain-containing protein [Sphingobacterium detergens]|uniref:Quercetin dioxygenase-like cupin family protein n=1 Tax=Sphingobacterium detergens TaxID=1145106 RepID=A0A420AR90_SPHD1|nr:cupin domain-containing protein [Sphingobacterium detergens]RKE46998.1 quercetin dioxygenase-like cupin family protein [Sphingobacterium detergens]